MLFATICLSPFICIVQAVSWKSGGVMWGRYTVWILDGADLIFTFSGAKIPKFSAINACKCPQLITKESVRKFRNLPQCPRNTQALTTENVRLFKNSVTSHARWLFNSFFSLCLVIIMFDGFHHILYQIFLASREVVRPREFVKSLKNAKIGICLKHISLQNRNL